MKELIDRFGRGLTVSIVCRIRLALVVFASRLDLDPWISIPNNLESVKTPHQGKRRGGSGAALLFSQSVSQSDSDQTATMLFLYLKLLQRAPPPGVFIRHVKSILAPPTLVNVQRHLMASWESVII